MKRHESLVPLSRDHHFGLIMAQRLVLGQATNPRADWPTDRAQQATRLVEFFKSDLRAHFDIEETHVFPAAGRRMADGDRQVEALIADHDAMRAMIRGLEADPASGLDERLPAFGHLLKAHIHREEHQRDVLQLSKSGKRVIGRVGRAPSHAATSNKLLMN